ncbi:ABC transporter substrate-binding protein [Paraburkholderia nemoris]|uniref:ABC transporter substrate-binding protein n=1 Tax=Paraburkholderia nemoris TaxID=2793076 RepID=UPI001B23C12C|nr:ABC transporter substrate-binding protein [Paraburkholderia nemoris]CAE6807832.1 hypothetical protein LMG22931_05727 [Paraburkholderia nemoris]
MKTGAFHLKQACGLLLALLGSVGIVHAETMTVTSWGGAYSKSQIEAMQKPYSASSGIEILPEEYNGGLAEIEAQVKTGNVKWDVVDVEYAEALRGCDEGLFERIDAGQLPAGADGTPARQDFLSARITKCAVSNVSYSNVIAYDKARYGNNSPKTIEDFFDVKKWPGKRGLKKEPNVNLEMALVADGVKPEDVYSVLSTPAGLDRAFAKLDTIKHDVVWWQAGAQPAQLLASGEVTMTTVYHGRIYDADIKDGKNFAIVWDGQVQVPDFFVVVKGSRHAQAAQNFIRFATGTKPLAEQTRFIPYAPSRKSSMLYVDPKVTQWLPTGNHPGRKMTTDAEWWADHADEVNQRFANWLAK